MIQILNPSVQKYTYSICAVSRLTEKYNIAQWNYTSVQQHPDMFPTIEAKNFWDKHFFGHAVIK